MPRRIFSAIMLSLLVISTLTLAFKQPAKAQSTTIIVPDEYPTIQGAINNASGGDTILVRNGTYYENVVVNKAVSLTGENKYGTIIDANGVGTVVFIESSGVSVIGFTLRGSGTEDDRGVVLIDCDDCNVSDNVISNNYQGLYLVRGWRNSFYRNTIKNNNDGAFLTQMQQTTFKSNYLSNNTYACSILEVGAGNDIDTSNLVDGKPLFCLTNQQNTVISPASFPDVGYLALQGSRNVTITSLTSEGISLSYCTNCTIENSTVSNSIGGIWLETASNNTISQNIMTNSYCGVYAGFSSDTNTIADNAILGNLMGITIANSVDNLVFGNRIVGNGMGVGIWYPTGGNKIFHNNFINNSVQASQRSINIWDDGYPSSGNYWSDYAGNDTYSGPYQNETGRDGIGDTPYSVGIVDHYPLMKPYAPLIGDVNKDRKVDMIDIGIVASSFGSSQGDPRWNPLADVNLYGKADLRDIGLVARHFGEHL